jgi:ABC-type amino acid transport system permease subunit
MHWPAAIPPWFLHRLLSGMVVNFEIAAIALVAGLIFGLPLAVGCRSGTWLRGPCAVGIAGMRAAPTFVVMFFLLNVIPQKLHLAGWPIVLSGAVVVALSLVPYSASYAADNGTEALQHWHDGEKLAALLIFPAVARAFFVLVMSSGAGAAIGVTEAITVILRQAEILPEPADKALLFAVSIACFAIPLQAGFLAVSMVRRALSRIATAQLATAS